MLYTYDLTQDILVFMTITDKTALWRDPFLDRGVRKLAGNVAYVCSISTAQKYLDDHKGELPCSSKDTQILRLKKYIYNDKPVAIL